MEIGVAKLRERICETMALEASSAVSRQVGGITRIDTVIREDKDYLE